MSQIRINNLTNKTGTNGPVIAGVSTVSSSAFMVMPSGDTAIRGAGSGRMLLMGGFGNAPAATYQNQIQRLTIASTGNAIDFGDMSTTRYVPGTCASSTRGIAGGGENPSGAATTIDYITISSLGGANDFGNLRLGEVRFSVGLSDSTRGLIAGGYVAPATDLSSIDFVTIATTGNTSSFGDLTEQKLHCGACASPTRGIVMGGYQSSPVNAALNTIEFITIATGGDGTDFGSLTVESRQGAGLSNTTRGIQGGGSGSTARNVIAFITIATTGDAIDFGDLIAGAGWVGGGASSTRGVFAGGYHSGGLNRIEFITIATTGDATDFGDLVGPAVYGCAGLTDVHGGLG